MSPRVKKAGEAKGGVEAKPKEKRKPKMSEAAQVSGK
jgi:hypothetical protein